MSSTYAFLVFITVWGCAFHSRVQVFLDLEPDLFSPRDSTSCFSHSQFYLLKKRTQATLWFRSMIDDFQLFKERRKRVPLSDITGQNFRLQNKRLRSSEKSTALLTTSPAASPVPVFGIHKRSTVQHKKEPLWPQNLQPMTHASISNTAAGNDKKSVLLLNLKNVVVDSLFSSSNPDTPMYFDFVHFLVDYNYITKESNNAIKEFANRHKLNQIRSLRGKLCKNGIGLETREVKVTKSTEISAFMTAICAVDMEDCLLLNTSGNHRLANKTIVLLECEVLNLAGKATAIYTEWEAK